MNGAVGIDLGRAYLKAAYVGKDESIEFLRDKNGDRFMPSCVFISPEGIAVGNAAREKAASNPENFVERPLCYLGDPDWSFQCGNEKYNAVFLAALIFKYLHQEIGAALGEDVTHAVAAVPAFFGDTERTALNQAASIVGLNSLRLVNQNTAVGLACVQSEGLTDGHIVVCGMGFGPFETSAIKIANGSAQVQATVYSDGCSGKDCITDIAHYLRKKFEEEISYSLDAHDERSMLLSSADRVFFALADDYSTDILLSKTLPSGYSAAMDAIDNGIGKIKTLCGGLRFASPFDYYDFLKLDRSDGLEEIAEALNIMKAQKTAEAQESPLNSDRYRAADDLVTIARAKRVFSSEASRKEYDDGLDHYKNSFMRFAHSENLDGIECRHFSEESIFREISREASRAVSSLSDVIGHVNGAPNEVLAYFSCCVQDMKIMLNRDDAAALLEPAAAVLYGHLKRAVEDAGWVLGDVERVICAGGFAQSSIIYRTIEKLLRADGNDAAVVQAVPVDYAARGALINSAMLT
ncbi:MAG: Hsp70 family protein [Synergistaceae bacterium]|jgi:molecular chaperone DnaK (HSP70)|nr:Hsp70 family protein [Synergistaceae bacterium]